MTSLLFIGIAFAFGLVLGDRRGVKQANQILDANMRELFKAIGDERPMPVESEDAELHRPTLHRKCFRSTHRPAGSRYRGGTC